MYLAESAFAPAGFVAPVKRPVNRSARDVRRSDHQHA